MNMKSMGVALLALGSVTATVGTAEARDGCGLGFHRNFYGYCRPNGFYRPYVVRPIYYGYGWRGPGWHRPWGWRHRYYGWHRPWGWHRHFGWHRHWGWHRHVAWRGRWHHRW